MARAAQVETPCPHCEFVAKSGFGLTAHVRMRHPDEYVPGPKARENHKARATDEPGGEGFADVTASGQSEDPPPSRSVDDGPAPHRKQTTIRDIFKRRNRRGETAEPSTTGEKPPRRAGWGKAKRGRSPVGPLFETVYGSLGTRLEMHGGPNVAVGRTLTLQAPIMANKADEMVKGTVVDRVIQPAAKLFDAGEDAFGIAGWPALVWAWQQFPYARTALKPALEAAVLVNLEELAPALKKAKERRAKLAATITELAPELGIPSHDADGQPVDIVAAVLGNIFAGVETGVAGDGGPETGAADNGSGDSRAAESATQPG